MIEAAKAAYDQWANELCQADLADTLDACTLAWFHEILFGDGDSATADLTGAAKHDTMSGVPLIEAIKLLRLQQHAQERLLSVQGRDEESTDAVRVQTISKLSRAKTVHELRDVAGQGLGNSAGKSMSVHDLLEMSISGQKDRGTKDESTCRNQTLAMPPASPEQIEEFAAWFGHRFFEHSFAVLDGKDKQKASYEKQYKDEIYVFTVQVRLLLASDHFHHLNICDCQDAEHLFSRLIKLDELPKQNPLEGLLLLDRAWCDVDVARYLAKRYKILCKALFVIQLLLAWLAIFAATLASGASSVRLPHAVFAVSMALAFVSGLEKVLQPKNRWRLLRATSEQLESIIWCYRTRVGQFAVPANRSPDDGRAEKKLLDAIVNVRKKVLDDASLSRSSFAQSYPRHIYKHHQMASMHSAAAKPKNLENGQLDVSDDFQSPCSTKQYLQLRIEAMLAFYQGRIPHYARRRVLFEVAVVLLGMVASVFAYLQMFSSVVFVTAATTVLVSWIEFSDVSSKTERYTRAVSALNDLLDWWNSLSDIQKSARDSSSRVVLCAEEIFSTERLAWNSIKSHNSRDSPNHRDEEALGEGASTPAAQTSRQASTTNRQAALARVSPA